jgi:hypothetical protein
MCINYFVPHENLIAGRFVGQISEKSQKFNIFLPCLPVVLLSVNRNRIETDYFGQNRKTETDCLCSNNSVRFFPQHLLLRDERERRFFAPRAAQRKAVN